jgi:hypothetical protein
MSVFSLRDMPARLFGIYLNYLELEREGKAIRTVEKTIQRSSRLDFTSFLTCILLPTHMSKASSCCCSILTNIWMSQTITKSTSVRFPEGKEVPKVSDRAKEFCRRCLAYHQWERPDVLSIFQDPYREFARFAR